VVNTSRIGACEDEEPKNSIERSWVSKIDELSFFVMSLPGEVAVMAGRYSNVEYFAFRKY